MTTPPDLVRELADVGVPVLDIWDLVNARTAQYPVAIPILLDWLEHLDARVPGPERDRLREGLIRALTVKAARPAAAPVMIDQFKRAIAAGRPGEAWAIGNALSVVADDSLFDELAALASDPNNGTARQMIVHGLSGSRHPLAIRLLVDLLADDDVAAHAAIALGKLKAATARPALEALLDHPRPLVRREAKKALAKIGAQD